MWELQVLHKMDYVILGKSATRSTRIATISRGTSPKEGDDIRKISDTMLARSRGSEGEFM